MLANEVSAHSSYAEADVYRRRVMRLAGLQITRFGATSGGHFDNSVAAQIGGDARLI